MRIYRLADDSEFIDEDTFEKTQTTLKGILEEDGIEGEIELGTEFEGGNFYLVLRASREIEEETLNYLILGIGMCIGALLTARELNQEDEL